MTRLSCLIENKNTANRIVLKLRIENVELIIMITFKAVCQQN